VKLIAFVSAKTLRGLTQTLMELLMNIATGSPMTAVAISAYFWMAVFPLVTVRICVLLGVLVVNQMYMVSMKYFKLNMLFINTKTLFSDIKRILLVGNKKPRSDDRAAWIIDLENGNHCKLADYPIHPSTGTGSFRLAISRFVDKRGPVVCGGPKHNNDCYTYDLVGDNGWTEFNDNMIIGRHGHRSSVLYDGRWFITGGYGNTVGDIDNGIGRSTEFLDFGTFGLGPQLPQPIADHCQVTYLCKS